MSAPTAAGVRLPAQRGARPDALATPWSGAAVPGRDRPVVTGPPELALVDWSPRPQGWWDVRECCWRS